MMEQSRALNPSRLSEYPLMLERRFGLLCKQLSVERWAAWIACVSCWKEHQQPTTLGDSDMTDVVAPLVALAEMQGCCRNQS